MPKPSHVALANATESMGPTGSERTIQLNSVVQECEQRSLPVGVEVSFEDLPSQFEVGRRAENQMGNNGRRVDSPGSSSGMPKVGPHRKERPASAYLVSGGHGCQEMSSSLRRSRIVDRHENPGFRIRYSHRTTGD